MSSGYRTARAGTRLRHCVLLLVAVFAGAWAAHANAQQPIAAKPTPSEVTVFAAADMRPVLEVLGPYFERRTGIKINATFGSSGALSKQIQNGAPADIFIAADFLWAEQVVASGLTDSNTPTPYAKGVLVLWERKDGPFHPLDLSVLTRKDLKSVAIANPQNAPYGVAALAALKKMNYFDNVAPHLVQAESVGQAAQFGLSGNTQLALISESLAMSGPFEQAGTFVLFPFAAYLQINQCAVILKNGKHQTEAHTLLNYLTSPEIQQHLPQLGLQPVD